MTTGVTHTTEFAEGDTVETTGWWMDGREAVPEGERIVLVTKKTGGEWIGRLIDCRPERTVTVPTPLCRHIRLRYRPTQADT
jgi:hypothetical protein